MQGDREARRQEGERREFPRLPMVARDAYPYGIWIFVVASRYLIYGEKAPLYPTVY
jgi:hypothetical protein